MKRTVLVLAIAFAVAAVGFSQSYTVQEVRGRVERETASGRVAVAAGETLNANTVIHTGIGANVVLQNDGKTFTIPAVRSGRVSELATSGAASQVRISGNIATVDTGEVNRTTAQAATASARASDAAGDLDIAAE